MNLLYELTYFFLLTSNLLYELTSNFDLLTNFELTYEVCKYEYEVDIPIFADKKDGVREKTKLPT